MRRNTNSRAMIWLASSCVALATVSPALGADSARQQETIKALEALRSKAESEIEIGINDPGTTQIEIGNAVSFRFESSREGYLTALYIDGDGAVQVLLPQNGQEPVHLRSNELYVLDRSAAGTGFKAEPPLGRESVVAFLTHEPIDLTQLVGDKPSSASELPDTTSKLAARLAEVLADSTVAAGRYDLEVVQSVDVRPKPDYRSEEIVLVAQNDSKGVRGIRPPPIDLRINFSTGSYLLSNKARVNLDEVGKAINDARLTSIEFSIAGHTDDVGSAEYNEVLSERRARSVRQYLMDRHGVDPNRVASKGYGESRPVVPATTEEAREANRRVELSIVR